MRCITKHEHELVERKQGGKPTLCWTYVTSPGSCLPCEYGALLCVGWAQLQAASRVAAFWATRRPTIRPNRPRTELKISTTRILTNLRGNVSESIARYTPGETYKLGSAASANAAPLPFTPTEIPQMRLQTPTVMPPQKTAYPV